MNPELRFEYHDGWIERAVIGPRHEVNLAVCLDTVWNPGNDRVELRFGGIVNFPDVQGFFESVVAETSEVDGGPRIDTLHYDEKTVSKPGNLYLYIDVETIGRIRVHCQSIIEKSPE